MRRLPLTTIGLLASAGAYAQSTLTYSVVLSTPSPIIDVAPNGDVLAGTDVYDSSGVLQIRLPNTATAPFRIVPGGYEIAYWGYGTPAGVRNTIVYSTVTRHTTPQPDTLQNTTAYVGLVGNNWLYEAHWEFAGGGESLGHYFHCGFVDASGTDHVIGGIGYSSGFRYDSSDTISKVISGKHSAVIQFTGTYNQSGTFGSTRNTVVSRLVDDQGAVVEFVNPPQYQSFSSGGVQTTPGYVALRQFGDGYVAGVGLYGANDVLWDRNGNVVEYNNDPRHPIAYSELGWGLFSGLGNYYLQKPGSNTFYLLSLPANTTPVDIRDDGSIIAQNSITGRGLLLKQSSPVALFGNKRPMRAVP